MADLDASQTGAIEEVTYFSKKDSTSYRGTFDKPFRLSRVY